jgi:hypothetical protein
VRLDLSERDLEALRVEDKRTPSRCVPASFASSNILRSSGGSLRCVELSLLPRFEPGIMVELREDPAEETQPRLPTPAVRVAVTREQTSRFLGLREEGQDDVPQDQRRQEPSHDPNGRSTQASASTNGRSEVRLLQSAPAARTPATTWQPLSRLEALTRSLTPPTPPTGLYLRVAWWALEDLNL